MIIVTGVLVYYSFHAILYDQARGRIDRTMQDIARVANPAPAFLDESQNVPVDQTLSNPDNLDHYSSPTTFVQIDNANGYPEGRTSNMGAMVFPPNRSLNPKYESAYREVTLPGGTYLVEDRLFSSGGKGSFTIHVSEPLDQLNATFARTRETIGGIILFAIIAVTALSLLLARQATNPLNELTLAMREIGSDRLDRRLKWARRGDEIGKLAETFDEMLARLEAAFARERQFIQDASHELKTPLTSINANAQMLRRWGDADERIRSESLDTIVNESATLANMVNGMLTLAKADSGESIPKEPLPVAKIAQEAVHSAEPRAVDKNLYVRLHVQTRGTIVMGDQALLRQMISNLIDNAIKFTDRGGIDVYLKREPSWAVIEIHDTGSGIDADDISYVFERFYRTDKSRNRAVPGTGLGLAIVRSIARVHNGTVEAERLPAGGSCFRVRIPVAGEDVIEPS